MIAGRTNLSGQTLKAIRQRRSVTKFFTKRSVAALMGRPDGVHFGGIDAPRFLPPDVFGSAIAHWLL